MALKVDYRITDDEEVYKDLVLQLSIDNVGENMVILSQDNSELELSLDMFDSLKQAMDNLLPPKK